MSQEKRQEIYLDYAATTPVDPEVLLAMEPYWGVKFGNPGSIHRAGQEALKAVDDARQTLKDFLGAKALREIIFTGSATEANNLAINLVKSDLTNDVKPHVITTAIEHESVLEPIRALEKRGMIQATYLTPDKEGLISPVTVYDALRPETVLVSIGYANNEIGVIQDISHIAKIIQEWKNAKMTNDELRVLQKSIPHNSKFVPPVFHTDAAQATQFLDMNVDRLGVDMMTLSGHKIYGPKGIGALYVRDGVPLTPLVYGGGQEYGIRSGTENVPFIAGFAKAIELVEREDYKIYSKEIKKLRNYIAEKIKEIFPPSFINGSIEHRLPNNINICFPNTSSEILLIGLSERGVYVSTGAACSARAQKPSHVLRAIGRSEKDARSSIRVTLGKYTKKKEIDFFIKALVEIIKK